MKTGKKDNTKNRILDDLGYSLVELLVVIAILAILTGGVSLGISLAFSKDAVRCATTLNDAITEARMLAMSKEYNYSLLITQEGGNYVAYIIGTEEVDNAGVVSVEEKYKNEIDLEGDNKKKIEKIECSAFSGSDKVISDTNTVELIFNKTKGNVEAYKLAGSETKTDINMIFTVTPLRGNKTRTGTVSLITGTGKHKVGTF